MTDCRLSVEEFFEWQRSQGDLHELVDGEPSRLSEEKQASRKIMRAFWAASQALGDIKPGRDWLRRRASEFEGRAPLEVASEGWNGLARVLGVLEARAPGCTAYSDGRGPFDIGFVAGSNLLAEARHFLEQDSRIRE